MSRAGKGSATASRVQPVVEEGPQTRVVAAVDVTPLGRRVAERARLVAEQLDAALEILHVLEPLGDAYLHDGVVKLVRDHRTREAEDMARWLGGRAEVPVDLKVSKGSPVWEIVKAGKEARLVVVGASPVDHPRLGPVSARVAETSWTDVLVVRRQPRVPYRRVVAAVDLSELSAAAVELALELAPDADLSLVYALPSRHDGLMARAGMFPEEIDSSSRRRLIQAKEAMAKFAARWPGRVRTVVEHGPPAQVVEEVVRRRSADLVTVTNRGAGATKLVLMGTVAGRILQAVPCDVAVHRVPGEFRRP